jgi:hypothetical protein
MGNTKVGAPIDEQLQWCALGAPKASPTIGMKAYIFVSKYLETYYGLPKRERYAFEHGTDWEDFAEKALIDHCHHR